MAEERKRTENNLLIAWDPELHAGARGDYLAAHPDGRFERLPADLARMLVSVNRFRTPEQHARRLIDAGWEDYGDGTLEAGLHTLAERGLLVTAEEFLQALKKGNGEAEDSLPAPQQIDIIGIPTKNRTKKLERCLRSWTEHNRRHGRETLIAVVDASDEEASMQNRDCIDHLREEGGGRGDGAEHAAAGPADAGASPRFAYAGPKEKKEYLGRLMETLGAAFPEIDREILDFAFTGVPEIDGAYGANRNMLQLASAGSLLVSVDDDTVCRFRMDRYPETLNLTSAADPMTLEFAGSRKEAEQMLYEFDGDVLSVYERLLGREICKIVQEANPSEIHLKGLRPSTMRDMYRRGGHVAAAVGGVYGDHGMGSTKGILTLTGKLRRHLLADPDRYKEARATREVARRSAGYAIGPGLQLMGMDFGFDNRRLLPPFLPVLRDEDGLWAVTQRAVNPDGYLGYLPIAVLHDPGLRTGSAEQLREYAPRTTDVLKLLMNAYAPDIRYRTARERMKALGSDLFRIAALPIPELEELIRTLWIQRWSDNLEHMDELLLVYGRNPQLWAEDLEAFFEAVQQYAEDPAFTSPYDLEIEHGRDEAGRLFVKILRRFGMLLEAWPEIWNAVERLQSENAGVLQTWL